MPAAKRLLGHAWLAILAALLCLASTDRAAAAVPAPAVYFSHVYVALDKDTYEAVRGAPEMASLAAGGELQVEANSQAWTGFYLKGRHTWIEFFGDRGPSGLKTGNGGLVFTVEQPGGVRAVSRNWLTGFGERVLVAPSARGLGQQLVPWMSTLSLRDSDPAVTASVFELDPAYLPAAHPRAKIGNPLSREEYMDSEWLPDLLMNDITSVQVALQRPRLLELGKQLVLSGWDIRKEGKGFVATGPDMRVTATPAAAGKEGIRVIEFSLQREVPAQSTPLERVRLVVSGKTGRIELSPPR